MQTDVYNGIMHKKYQYFTVDNSSSNGSRVVVLSIVYYIVINGSSESVIRGSISRRSNSSKNTNSRSNGWYLGL